MPLGMPSNSLGLHPNQEKYWLNMARLGPHMAALKVFFIYFGFGPCLFRTYLQNKSLPSPSTIIDKINAMPAIIITLTAFSGKGLPRTAS